MFLSFKVPNESGSSTHAVASPQLIRTRSIIRTAYSVKTPAFLENIVSIQYKFNMIPDN